MSRTAGSSAEKTLEIIRNVALRLIYERGYEAMTMRGLAEEVGIQQGSLYYYFRTKQDLLSMLVLDHMHLLMASMEEALAGKCGPLEALEAFIVFHIDYHMTRKHEVFINYSELRSFSEENYRRVATLRRDYEQRLIGLIETAQKAGLVARRDSRIAAYGILAMLTGICQWYRPDGRLTREQIVAIYTAMALGALRADPQGPPETDDSRRFRQIVPHGQ